MDKSKLFVPALAEGEHEIDGLGTFRFRSLSRGEVLAIRRVVGTGDLAAAERKMVSAALLDPKLTEQEVKRWQDASAPGTMEPLVAAIAEVSGMANDSVKEAMSTFPE